MLHYTYSDFFEKNKNIFVQTQLHNNSSEMVHTHDFIELVYIFSGSGTHKIEGKEYPVKSGCVLFINYNQTHSFKGENMLICNILLKPEAISDQIINMDNAFEMLSLTAFSEFQEIDPTSPLIYFEGNDRRRVEAVINELIAEQTIQTSGSDTVMKGYLTVLLVYIFRQMLGNRQSFKEIPKEITEYISANFHEKLSIEHLAKKCYYTPKYFSRVFKECYGVTVTEYIQQKRIEEGRRLLTQTNMSIDEISHIIGYKDNVRFYKYFKKYYSTTPHEYRKSKKL